MSFRVVLTGGIASGKTAVATEFAALGIPIIDTDQINRDILEPGGPVLAKLVGTFGREILEADGTLNRTQMRERVFSDPAERRKLESITHPAIREELSKRAGAATGPYQIHAIPLYIERGSQGAYDRVLVVDVPEELQLKRLALRDGSPIELGQKILAAQVSRAARQSAADDIIENSGTLEELRAKVRALHSRYLALAAAKSPS